MKSIKLTLLFVGVLSFSQVATAGQHENLIGPKEAARIATLSNKGAELPDSLHDYYNDFVLNAPSSELRKYVKERKALDPKYNPLTDCHNPGLTMKQYAATCS